MLEWDTLQDDDGSGSSVHAGGLAALSRPWAYPRKLQAALLAEFIGMAIFQIYGGNAPDSVAAFGNGITLVVLGNIPPPPGLNAW